LIEREDFFEGHDWRQHEYTWFTRNLSPLNVDAQYQVSRVVARELAAHLTFGAGLRY
jgi:hypothetical protein